MDKEDKSPNFLPAVSGSFAQSGNSSVINVWANQRAYQMALVGLQPALTLLALPQIQEILKNNDFEYELDSRYPIILNGKFMFDMANDSEEKLLKRIVCAYDLLRQLPEKFGVDGNHLVKELLLSHANFLQLCRDRNQDKTGDLALLSIPAQALSDPAP